MFSRLLQKLKKWRYDRRVIAAFKNHYRDFLKKPERATDDRQQGLLREAFVSSRGETLEWAWELQKKISPHHRGDGKSKFFPGLNENEIEKAVLSIKKEGYYILPWRLPEEWVRSAREKAMNLTVTSRADPRDIQFPKEIRPKCATYWHNESDLYKIEEFKQLTQDAGIREIIGRYLKCEPVFDMVAAWWSFPSGAADSASAQLYHFDLDRIRWLKVFVTLTHVGPRNGPHAFVKGSHNTIGKMVSHHGRYSDEEVFTKYSESDEIVFTAPAGTVFIENTLGFHKGKPLQEGYRFLFEFEYSINHFGYPYSETTMG